MSLHDAKNKKNSMHWFSLKIPPHQKKKTFLYYSTHQFFMKPEKPHFGPIWPKNSRINFKNPVPPCKKKKKKERKKTRQKTNWKTDRRVNKECYFIGPEAVIVRCSSKQVLLKISQHSQENIGFGVSSEWNCWLEGL